MDGARNGTRQGWALGCSWTSAAGCGLGLVDARARGLRQRRACSVTDVFGCPPRPKRPLRLGCGPAVEPSFSRHALHSCCSHPTAEQRTTSHSRRHSVHSVVASPSCALRAGSTNSPVGLKRGEDHDPWTSFLRRPDPAISPPPLARYAWTRSSTASSVWCVSAFSGSLARNMSRRVSWPSGLSWQSPQNHSSSGTHCSPAQ